MIDSFPNFKITKFREKIFSQIGKMRSLLLTLLRSKT
jgi:hypothetical protein